MTTNAPILKGLKAVPRGIPKSRLDAQILTQATVSRWLPPDFQRPLKINAKVMALVEYLRTEEGWKIPGVLTIGILDGGTYIVDGQHRIEAFRLSERPEVYADIRVMEFEDATQMAEEFTKLNDSLVRMTADDKLRALESSNESLRALRKSCKFVGYGNIRRGSTAPVVSMSTALRAWAASAQEGASAAGKGKDVLGLARTLTMEDAKALALYLNAVYQAWGSDPEYHRLWNGLCLTLLAWLWRRAVLEKASHKTTQLTKEEFISCCMALSADRTFMDWLPGRRVETEKTPGYHRIKKIFLARLAAQRPAGGPKLGLPQPEWAPGQY